MNNHESRVLLGKTFRISNVFTEGERERAMFPFHVENERADKMHELHYTDFVKKEEKRKQKGESERISFHNSQFTHTDTGKWAGFQCTSVIALDLDW
jgi:hypothetical protein